VALVDHHALDTLQKWIVHHAAKQHPFSRHQKSRLRRGASIETDVIANVPPKQTTHLLGDKLSDRACCDSTRLNQDHLPLQANAVQAGNAGWPNPGRLSRAGRGVQKDRSARDQMRLKLRQQGIDR
jgi:hypothetical protein